jgi:hypothetical protein
MADKTENKPRLVASPPPRAEGSESPTPLDADGRKAFDPYRYQTHEVQLEDRIRWLNADLPSIGALEDTVPPNAGRSAPPPSTTEPLRESLETQTFATPAQVIEAPVPPTAQPIWPSIRRVKRDAAELTVIPRAERRRRHATIGVFVALFLVLALGVFAMTGQDKGVSPSGTVPTAVEASQLPVASSANELHQSALVPQSPQSTASVTAAQPPVPKDAPSSDAAPPGASGSRNHKVAPQHHSEGVKPPAPPQSTRPARVGETHQTNTKEFDPETPLERVAPN